MSSKPKKNSHDRDETRRRRQGTRTKTAAGIGTHRCCVIQADTGTPG
jgi:hypothetical protein